MTDPTQIVAITDQMVKAPRKRVCPHNPFPRGSKWYDDLNRLWAMAQDKKERERDQRI